MKELLLFGKPIDVYSAKCKAQNSKAGKEAFILFSGLPRPKRKSERLVEEMDDKAKLKTLFKKNGLPVPEGGTAWNFWQAKKIFRRIQEVRGERRERKNFLLSPSIPVIVKPREGSRGRHTTTFVSTLEDLKAAYDSGKSLCFWVVVEEQLFGPVYRATVVDFKVRGVLRGDHPFVEGDGSSSVENLISAKNQSKPERVGEIKIDENLKKYLHRQGLKLADILPAGRKVELSEKIGLAYGGNAVEELDICHPDNLELFARAARVVDDSLIGFDFIGRV
jgi:D-alanine-D-alanine ligase-like ATP-grasp enzyme